MEFEIEDIELAYKKLKSNIYYDSSNTNIFLREKIAKFEAEKRPNIEQKLKKLLYAIRSENRKYFDNLLKKITYNLLPKKISTSEGYDKNNFLSNQRKQNKYFVESYNVFIDAPIELHIISVLWILEIGTRIENGISENAYGNRLLINNETKEVEGNLSLFKPYYKQYQNWRQKAFDAAQSLHATKKDLAILSLDIKNFYNSVRISYEEMRELNSEFSRGNEYLWKIFIRMHYRYSMIISRNEGEKGLEESFLLPIGLLSSSILANWYLSKFDKEVEKKVNPIYYGRYVDDIVLVISSSNLRECSAEENPIGSFLNENLFSVISYSDNDQSYSNNIQYKIKGYSNLILHEEKSFLYIFNSDEPISVLEKIKKDLEERSSEFRLLPTEENSKDFDEIAYELNYDDSFGRIKTLKDYRENRYGLSIYLAKIIMSILRDKTSMGTEVSKIVSFFRGSNLLEFYRLWEKLFTIFIIKNDVKSFIVFYENCMDVLDAVSLQDGSVTKNKEFINDLFNYLKISFLVSLSLNPIFQKSVERRLKTKYKSPFYKLFFDDVFVDKNSLTISLIDKSMIYRKSNMLRHHYVIKPLFNYTKEAFKNIEFSLISNEAVLSLEHGRNESIYNLEEILIKFSPRRVKFYETTIFTFYQGLFDNILNNQNTQLLYSAFELFYKINYHYFDRTDWRNVTDIEYCERMRGKYFLLLEQEKDVNRVKVISDIQKNTEINIAVANIKIQESNVKANIKGKQNLKGRDSKLSSLINAAIIENVEMLVLPEFSVPDLFLSSFGYISAKEQLAFVFGMEHIIANNYAYNFVVNVLPIEVDGIKDAIVIPRLKNHYAPSEEDLLKGYKLKIPKTKVSYDLINWRGFYFSTYYCFELANIEHRAIFRSYVDFLIASEWNKDVNYFSNIVESAARDIHCAFIQVNTSQFGDSRIVLPKKTEEKDVLRIKGGENTTILVGKINIDELRQFQLMEYNLQQKDKNYKLTPPDFDRENVKKRINNELF